MSTLPPYTLLPMPALSPTMTSGNLASWKKAEGDAINVGDDDGKRDADLEIRGAATTCTRRGEL